MNHFFFGVLPISESCGNYYLRINPAFYVPPYTVNFVSSPAGFNPSLFNGSHPVQSLEEVFYGSDENPVPLGAYEIQITDACGNSYTHEFEIIDEALPTWLSAINQSTCSGQIGISMSGGREMVSVILTDAPDAYPSPLPDDVSEFIDGSEFLLTGLPLGDYVFEVTITDNKGAKSL